MKTLTEQRRTRRGMMGVALAFSLAAASLSPAHAADGAQATVQNLYGTLLGSMKSGASLGKQQRYDKIAPAIRQDFDVAYMTRMAVGPAGWAALNDTQRQAVTAAFEHYMTATYADRFDSFSGEQLKVTGEQNSASGNLVLSQIVKSDGKPVQINYLMRQNNGAWQIADVYLTGTISEVATQRSQFSSVLLRQGFDGLVAMLNQKTDTLLSSNGGPGGA